MKSRAMFLSALLIAGCSSVGQKVDQSAVSKIQKGVSTKEDVRHLIGNPNNVTTTSDGSEVWSYTFMHTQVKGTTFIPIVGAFAGGADTQHQDTTVTFRDGVVTQYSTSYGGTDVTQGMSAGGGAKVDGADGNRKAK